MTQPAVQSQQVDAAYQAQRLRLSATVTAAVASAWASLHTDRERTIQHVVALVTAGQAHTVRLVEAYMRARSIQETGAAAKVSLDPARYTTEKLRGIPVTAVYSRPFGAYGAFINDGADKARAVEAAQASVTKLARTDLQLAQTHAARDWMEGDEFIVGWRRVLNGDKNCALCTAAASRTYRTSDLMPIHENCDCTVQPLWGTEPVASVGTTVLIQDDPELGPRLMAESWSPVGPRLIERPE